MQTQSIEQKQQYLRVNIIDAGYDAQQFVEYCTNQHNLDDLADWTLQKLKNVVKLFINTKVQNKKQQNTTKIQLYNQQDDWSTFQTSNPASNLQQQQKQQKLVQHKHNENIDNHHNASKNGHLVFSQADWSIFLGGGSLQTKPQEISTNNNNLISNSSNNNYPELNSLSFGNKNVQKKQEKKVVNVVDINKINTSKATPKKVENIKSTSNNTNKKQEPKKQQVKSSQVKDNSLSISTSLVQNKSFKGQSRGPINFSNVKLMTGKVNQMPKLAVINDIFITKTQQISRNFLQSDYTQYHIHFRPGNHIIQRKFADFRKLRSLLQKLYPHIRMPYLQPQGWLTSSQGKDSETLSKYKWMIIDFLKYIIIRNQQLKNCSLVRKFCGYTTNLKAKEQTEEISKGQLKKLFESFDNYPKISLIKQLPLSKGKIVIPPCENGQKYIHNTLTVLQQIDYQYQKLRKKFQTLFYYYDLLGKSMCDVSSSFQSLQNIIKKYNYQNNQPIQFRVYQGIKQTCNKMRNTINDQFVLFKSRVKNIFRYQKDNMMTLKQLIQQKNKIHTEYIKQNYPILSNSGQSLNGEVQIDSNISIDQPSKANKNLLCVQEIFWAYSVKEEIKSYWEELRKKINQHLTIIAYQQLDNQNDNLNFWNSMIKKSVI